MSFSDFFQWKDYKAQQKLLKSTNRVLLRDIVSIKAERGKYVLFTKSQFNDEQYTTLDFLQKKYMNKKGMTLPSSHTENCGIPIEKRDDILSNLSQILPKNRKQFWENITVHKQ